MDKGKGVVVDDGGVLLSVKLSWNFEGGLVGLLLGFGFELLLVFFFKFGDYLLIVY